MARYIDASCRICRRNGLKLFLKGERCLTPKCGIERRSTPPGQTTRRRRKQSDRGLQLREKQKGRYYYGVLERPFQKLFAEAARRPGKTGETLVQLLESRLDNVILLMGFADSHKQARQVIRHGHLTLNDKKIDIPSVGVNAGDSICWDEGSKKTELFKAVTEKIGGKTIPAWLSVDHEKMCGKVLSVPTRQDVEIHFDENAVVAYYSR